MTPVLTGCSVTGGLRQLTRQGIHTDEDIRAMCFLATWLGAASIRFTELQNASDDNFIGADEFFDDLPENKAL